MINRRCIRVFLTFLMIAVGVSASSSMAQTALSTENRALLVNPEKSKTINNSSDPLSRFADLRRHQNKGQYSARLALVELTDYQCHFCKRHHQKVFPKIKEKYIDSGILKYQVWQFPLAGQLTPQATSVRASQAAACAEQQEMFWPMHHALFKASQQLSEEPYIELASQLGLAEDTFTACMAGEIPLSVIYDVSYGRQLGASGTPHFLVGWIKDNRLLGARLMRGAKSFESFDAMIKMLQQEVLRQQPQE